MDTLTRNYDYEDGQFYRRKGLSIPEQVDYLIESIKACNGLEFVSLEKKRQLLSLLVTEEWLYCSTINNFIM